MGWTAAQDFLQDSVTLRFSSWKKLSQNGQFVLNNFLLFLFVLNNKSERILKSYYHFTALTQIAFFPVLPFVLLPL